MQSIANHFGVIVFSSLSGIQWPGAGGAGSSCGGNCGAWHICRSAIGRWQIIGCQPLSRAFLFSSLGLFHAGVPATIPLVLSINSSFFPPFLPLYFFFFFFWWILIFNDELVSTRCLGHGTETLAMNKCSHNGDRVPHRVTKAIP